MREIRSGGQKQAQHLWQKLVLNVGIISSILTYTADVIYIPNVVR